jgi:hypothetical protein
MPMVPPRPKIAVNDLAAALRRAAEEFWLEWSAIVPPCDAPLLHGGLAVAANVAMAASAVGVELSTVWVS